MQVCDTTLVAERVASCERVGWAQGREPNLVTRTEEMGSRLRNGCRETKCLF